MIFIIGNNLNSLWLNFVLWIGFFWASNALISSLSKVASEAQKPLAKMDFFTSLWLVGYR